MFDIMESSSSSKISNLENSKCYALWRIYIIKCVRKDRVFSALTEDAPDDTTSTTATNRFDETYEKARPHIVLNLGDEPEPLVT